MDKKNEECYKLKYKWDICSSKIFLNIIIVMIQ